MKQEITRTYCLTIFNTVQSSLNGMSCNAAVEGFFQSLMALLKRYNALLFAGEIQCGMSHTGRWWACEYEGIVPDVLVMGKGLAGGYTSNSALVRREDVMDALKPTQHVFTFTGHSECSLAASLIITEQWQLIEHTA